MPVSLEGCQAVADCKEAALKLFEVDSNAPGGGGTHLFHERHSDLKSCAAALSTATRGFSQVVELVDSAKSNLIPNIRSSYREFVPRILVALGLPQAEAELLCRHRLEKVKLARRRGTAVNIDGCLHLVVTGPGSNPPVTYSLRCTTDLRKVIDLHAARIHRDPKELRFLAKAARKRYARGGAGVGTREVASGMTAGRLGLRDGHHIEVYDVGCSVLPDGSDAPSVCSQQSSGRNAAEDAFESDAPLTSPSSVRRKRGGDDGSFCSQSQAAQTRRRRLTNGTCAGRAQAPSRPLSDSDMSVDALVVDVCNVPLDTARSQGTASDATLEQAEFRHAEAATQLSAAKSHVDKVEFRLSETVKDLTAGNDAFDQTELLYEEAPKELANLEAAAVAAPVTDDIGEPAAHGSLLGARSSKPPVSARIRRLPPRRRKRHQPERLLVPAGTQGIIRILAGCAEVRISGGGRRFMISEGDTLGLSCRDVRAHVLQAVDRSGAAVLLMTLR